MWNTVWFFLQRSIDSLSADEMRVVIQHMNAEAPRLVAYHLGRPDPTLRVVPCPQPKWCSWGICIPLESTKNNICCQPDLTNGQTCIVQSQTLRDMCMNPGIVEIAGIVNYSVNFHVDPTFSNSKYRNQAYRFFVIWQYGKLGMGQRRAIPACVVTHIRAIFPDEKSMLHGISQFVWYRRIMFFFQGRKM